MNESAAWQTYRRLIQRIVPYKALFLLAIFGNILYGLVDASFIKFFQPLLDEGFVEPNPQFIQWAPVLIVVIFLLRGVASFFSSVAMGTVGRNVVRDFRADIFQRLLKMPTGYFDRMPAGKTLATLTYNVEQVAQASSDALTIVVRESFTALFIVAVMIQISWQLTGLFIILGPILAIIIASVSRRMRRTATKIQGSIGSVNHIAEESIGGQREIKAYGQQAFEWQRFKTAIDSNRAQEIKLLVTAGWSMPLIQLIGAFALALLVWLATHQTGMINTRLTPGEFAALITAMVALLKPIRQLTKINATIQKGIAGAASLFELLAEPVEASSHPSKPFNPKQAIVIEDLSFQYDTQHPANHDVAVAAIEKPFALKGLSLTLEAGKTTALVGRSGSGKSTLAQLLLRFYEPTQGQLSIDGVALTEIDLQEWRQQCAYVSQQVYLFNDTIYHNIAYGSPNASMDEVRMAAEKAHALSFIESMPEGFNTKVGGNGIRLSGGQRQRIAIARAILKDAPILIMDEATSALDAESEKAVQEAMDALCENRTTVIVAHRLSTIRNADQIVVLEAGELVEMGCHETLQNQQGAYARFLAIQQKGTDNEAVAHSVA